MYVVSRIWNTGVREPPFSPMLDCFSCVCVLHSIDSVPLPQVGSRKYTFIHSRAKSKVSELFPHLYNFEMIRTILMKIGMYTEHVQLGEGAHIAPPKGKWAAAQKVKKIQTCMLFWIFCDHFPTFCGVEQTYHLNITPGSRDFRKDCKGRNWTTCSISAPTPGRN